MKQWMSLLLTLALAGTLAVPVWAAESEEIETAETVEEEYEEYVETEYEKGWSEGWEDGYADSEAKALIDFLAGVPYTDELTWEEGYEDGYSSGTREGYGAAYEKFGEISEKNGVPGRVNVLWNGTCIAFPEVQPEIRDGRTMIPVRAVMESMGAEVSYEQANRSVSISMGKGVVTFIIGSQTATLSSGGADTEIQMDCASYLKDDSTMVPLRFLSEACGYTVLWDQDYRTAVVVDRDAWAKDTDVNQVSKLDGLFQKVLARQQGEKLKQTGTFTVDIQSYDYETEGMKSTPISGTITACTEGMKGYIEGTLNLNALLSNEDFTLSTDTLPNIDLSAISFSMLIEEEGGMYFTSPLLSSVAGENTWICVGNLSDFGMGEAITVGGILADSILTDETDAFHIYDRFQTARTQLTDLFGDAIATANGNGYTWTIKSDNQSGYSGTSTLMPDGTGSIDIQMTQMDEETDSGTTVTVKADMTAAQSKADIDVITRWFGTDDSRIHISVQTTNEIVDTAPDFALPEGATVMTQEEVFYGAIPAEE